MVTYGAMVLHMGLHPLDQSKKTRLLSVWLPPRSKGCHKTKGTTPAAIEISFEQELVLNLKASMTRYESCGKDGFLLLCDHISLIYVRMV